MNARVCAAFLLILFSADINAQIDSDDAAFWKSFKSDRQQVEQRTHHYVTGGSGEVVVLLHGWPQTWYEWRAVMPELAKRYRVIAPDLPGLGESSTSNSYDKITLARHVHALLGSLNAKSVYLVGHDMGAIVAYAFARQFPAETKAVVVIDAPIPGLGDWLQLRSQWPRWHFAFHNLPDLPEALVSGKERIYFTWFFNALTYNKRAFTDASIDRYVEAYKNPAVLHAGFEYYRAFEKDAQDYQDHARNKLTMPVLALGGEQSRLNRYVIDQLRDATTRLTGELVPQSGHWIPEEQPQWLAERLVKFFSEN